MSEIPQRLILEGAAKGQANVPRPAYRSESASNGYSRYKSAYEHAPAYSRPSSGGISGVQKGFSTIQSGRSSYAAPAQGLKLFKPGDKVIHGVFGRGEIVETIGEGSDQKVIVKFSNGSQKRFSANVAPIKKIE